MRVYVGSGGSTRVDKTSVTVSMDCMRGNEVAICLRNGAYWTGYVIAG
jgi:hypothetical protein